MFNLVFFFLSTVSLAQIDNTKDIYRDGDTLKNRITNQKINDEYIGLYFYRENRNLDLAGVNNISGLVIAGEVNFGDFFSELFLKGEVINGLEQGYWVYRYVEEWVFIYEKRIGSIKGNIWIEHLKDSTQFDSINKKNIECIHHFENQIKAIAYFDKGRMLELFLFDRYGNLIVRNKRTSFSLED